MRTDGQTNMMKLILAYRKLPTRQFLLCVSHSALRLLPYPTLTGAFQNQNGVFTVRYGLDVYTYRCCRGKAARIIYFECVVCVCGVCVCVCSLAVVTPMQIACLLRCIILSSVACLVLPFFSHLIKGTISRKKVIEHKMCGFSLKHV
jgi:hypothetical protein